MLERGSLFGERFEVLARLGAGAMGTVVRARDRETGDEVAIKVLRGASAGDLERFAREARVLARLRHPGIVRYVGHGETPAGERWLAMEWVDGEDLGTRLAGSPLGVAETIALGRRAADALEAAHAEGVVHRDVKPSNLLLPGGRADEVKVVDFGIARLDWATSPATRPGTVLGTPGYIAPEQVRGDELVDARADLFSLGCVLYRCLAGRPPFVGAHATAVLAKVLLEDPPTLRTARPEVPEALETLVARMLAKDPAHRPAHAAEVSNALDDLARGGPAAPTPAAARRALTLGERRQFSVVFARTQKPLPPPEELAAIVRSSGGRIDRIREGALVATIPGSGSAFDQAATAARAALAMQGYDADAPIAVATGSAEVEGRWPVGEAIDRAVALIGEPGRVRVDELTAGLVGPRFRIARDAHGLSLVGPADDSDEPPLLLGRPSPFVGREWELGWLAETFEECVREETAHVALVTGEPGIGKSRLLVELLARLAARAVVLRGRADPVRAGAPFSVLGDAVRRAAGIRDADPPDVRRRSLRARVERSGAGEAARVTTFLGELSASPFPDDESPFLRAARADPIVMSDQIRRAFEDWLGAEAERPVILALEDLQWADLPSVRVVASALRTLRSRPLLVLGFARPGVHDVFPGLWAEAGLAELRLEGLSRANAEAIAHAALREGTDAARVAEIALRAEGNPLTLEELVRVEAQGPRAAGAQTVRAMMRARLEAEDARARRGLRAASVFGSTFPGAGVAALLAESEDRVESLLADLASRELLVRRADGWGFRHDLVREAAAEMLTDEDARLGHRLAAEWLLAAGETDALRLAEHFERGGEGRRAVPQLLAAARQALEANDLEAAVRRADRGLACGAEGAERGGLLLAQAEAHKWQGRQVEMLRCASEAASLLAPGSAPWCAAIAEVANASMRLGDPDRIVEVTRALFEIERPDPLEAWVVAAARTGQALLYAGRHDALAGLALRLEAVVTSVADLGPFARARLSFLRGARALVAGDLETFLSRMADAIAHSEAAGDRRGASMARAERGYGLLQGGCDEEAARELGLALEGARRIGLAHVVAHAENNLGLVALRRGDLSEAHALEERAMEAYRAQGNRRAEGGCRTYMAEIDLLAGDHQRAEREARVAVDLLGTAPLGALALATLARVLAAAERGAEALVPAREAMRRLETLGRLEEGEAVVRLALAEALAAAGDKEAAAETLASGRAWLLARAEGIEDPELRARFLERVPEHARILEWDPTTSGSRTA